MGMAGLGAALAEPVGREPGATHGTNAAVRWPSASVLHLNMHNASARVCQMRRGVLPKLDKCAALTSQWPTAQRPGPCARRAPRFVRPEPARPGPPQQSPRAPMGSHTPIASVPSAMRHTHSLVQVWTRQLDWPESAPHRAAPHCTAQITRCGAHAPAHGGHIGASAAWALALALSMAATSARGPP